MEQLVFTEFLNHLFGGPVLAVLNALGIHPKNPAAPITNAVAMEILCGSTNGAPQSRHLRAESH